MPSPRKKKPDDKAQKSLISFVSEKEKKKEKPTDTKKDTKTEKIKEEKKAKETSIKVEETTKEIPSKLYFKGNDEPFGLKAGNIKLTKVLRENVSSKYIRYLIEKNEIVSDMERGFLLDVDYDGGQNKAYCKFYDLDSNDIKIWIDTTDHEPYCLSKEPISELEKLYYTEKTGQKKKLTQYEGFNRFEEIERFDLLSDQQIDMTKIYGKTPTNVGGSGTNIRNILGNNDKRAWEADIRYHLNYIFDRQLIPGLIYKIKNGKLEKINFENIDENSKKMAMELRELFKSESPEIQEFSEEFLDIFITPIPEIKRMAMDIEVMVGERDYRIPDPRLAKQKVISISFVATDGLKLVYMLERAGYIFEKLHINFLLMLK